MKTWRLVNGFAPEGDELLPGEEVRVIELGPLLDLLERLLTERDANCEVAVGLAERAHHELDDYAAYSNAMDALVGDGDAEVEALLRQHGRLQGDSDEQ